MTLVFESNMSKLDEQGKPIFEKMARFWKVLIINHPTLQSCVPDVHFNFTTLMENNVIARTGRVQSWMDDPTARLPVSCTVFVVEDSMEGPNGIEASWRFVSHALRYGAGVAVHLSKFEPAGQIMAKGLLPLVLSRSGKSILVLTNSCVAVVSTKTEQSCCTLTSPIPTSLNLSSSPRHELPWAKRCVNLSQLMLGICFSRWSQRSNLKGHCSWWYLACQD